MADIAKLGIEADSSGLEKLTASLKAIPPAASAAERAADKFKSANDNAARTMDDFSKRVQRNVKDLQFQTDQLKRSAAEQERHNALRRAGVAAASAEGIAITNAVAGLQAQRAALQQTSVAARASSAAVASLAGTFKTMLATLGPLALAMIAIQKAGAAFEFASGLDESAEQIGVTAKNLQALQFAAVQSGVKMEQLDTGLSKFSQKMGEAADGSKEMVEALTKLGVKNLDAAGKLRPTEDQLVDLAKAITAIEDPAIKSANAVTFFGKSGTRMLPMLAEIAGGMDELGKKATDAGAIIDAKTIKTLDDLNDRMARLGQVSQAGLARALAAVVEWSDRVDAKMKEAGDSVRAWASGLADDVGKLLDDLAVEGAAGAAMFLETFKSMPEILGDIFFNAWSIAKSVTKQGINEITAAIADSKLGRLIGLEGGTNLDTGVTLRGTGDVGSRITGAGATAAADMQAQIDAARQARFSRSVTGARATSTMGDAARTGTAGARTTAIKGAGKEAEDAAKKYAKLTAELDLSIAAQEKMTAAAGKGETAYQAMKNELEAQQKALDIFGKALDANDPRLRALIDKMTKLSQLKAAEQFSLGTTELKQQNEVLQRQIEIIGESTEVQAREVAIIKARQEAEKGGVAITQEMIDARRQMIEQNENLKNQAEELKRSQELWMEPVKSALQSIQQTAADAFESMLTNGKFSFEELGQVFKKTLIRMVAEFLALETVRPVMSVLVNAISPAMAGQMGLGAGGIGGGGIGGFLGQTLFGGSENFGPLQPGAASLGSSGGLTVGGALGGLAGIGAGTYSLLSGKGSMGSMIGGGLGIAGGLTSLAGPMLGLGAAAGPIGLGLGLLGGILPGLFGGGAKTPPVVRTSQNIPLGKDVAALFRMLGGVKNQGAVWGLGSENISQTGEPGWDFSSTSTFLQRPGGGQELWRMNTEGMDATGMGQVALKSILGGAVGNLTKDMQSALQAMQDEMEFTVDDISAVVTGVQSLEKSMKDFGRDVGEGEMAVNAINDQFDALRDSAMALHVTQESLIAIETERARQQLKMTDDFVVGIDQAIRAIETPLDASLRALDRLRAKDLAENADYVRLVAGYQDQASQIERLYYLQRNELIDQANAQAIAAQKQANNVAVSAAVASLGQLEGFINSLSPGGALSNLDPAGQLAGLRGSYNAAFAQAQADPTNSDAVARAAQTGQAYAQFAQSFYGGSAQYAGERDFLLGQAQALQTNIAQTTITRVSDPAQLSVLQQILAAIGERQAEVERLTGLMARLVANQAA